MANCPSPKKNQTVNAGWRSCFMKLGLLHYSVCTIAIQPLLQRHCLWLSVNYHTLVTNCCPPQSSKPLLEAACRSIFWWNYNSLEHTEHTDGQQRGGLRCRSSLRYFCEYLDSFFSPWQPCCISGQITIGILIFEIHESAIIVLNLKLSAMVLSSFFTGISLEPWDTQLCWKEQ